MPFVMVTALPASISSAWGPAKARLPTVTLMRTVTVIGPPAGAIVTSSPGPGMSGGLQFKGSSQKPLAAPTQAIAAAWTGLGRLSASPANIDPANTPRNMINNVIFFMLISRILQKLNRLQFRGERVKSQSSFDTGFCNKSDSQGHLACNF
jgi:hypothetical protein